MNGSNSKRNGVCGRIPYVIKRGRSVALSSVNRWFWLLWVVAFLVSGCGGGRSIVQGLYVNVTVVEKDTSPVMVIEGAAVKIGSAEAVTGESGSASFKNVPRGRNFLEVTKPGYKPYGESVVFSIFNFGFLVRLRPEKIR